MKWMCVERMTKRLCITEMKGIRKRRKPRKSWKDEVNAYFECSGLEHAGGCKACKEEMKLEHCCMKGMMCCQLAEPRYIKWL